MDKCCRWCKHYDNGSCNKAQDNFIVEEIGTWIEEDISDTVCIVIREPEKFYCKDWE